MTRVKAQELLDEPGYASRLTMDGLNRLLLKAGYTAEQAHKVAMQHGFDRLSAGQSV